jgi:diamine N-acetyltransferase
MLGIIIGEKEYRGQGLGKEITMMGLEYGFNSLGLKKILLHVNNSNIQAIKLYTSIGFAVEGKLRDHYYFDGIWYDVIIMAIFGVGEKV